MAVAVIKNALTNKANTAIRLSMIPFLGTNFVDVSI
jgi:hypothetical protein